MSHEGIPPQGCNNDMLQSSLELERHAAPVHPPGKFPSFYQWEDTAMQPAVPLWPLDPYSLPFATYSGEILCGGYIEEVIGRMYLLVDCHMDLGNQRLLTSSPFHPGVVPSARYSHSGSLLQGHSLERVMCGWDYLNWIHDWTSADPLNFLTLWWVETKIYLSCQLSKISLISKFPCVWNLPLPNLEWPLSWVSSCLPCTGPSLQTIWVIQFILLTGWFPKL